MAQQNSITIPAHHNIYTGKAGRELRIDFSLPQTGINKNTGLVVFVPGFGGNIDSKVYKKMRDAFADKFNLITIQCDYFGSSFMQDAENFHISDIEALNSLLTKKEKLIIDRDPSSFLKTLSEKDVVFPVVANLNEDIDNFNDMSFMQAIDIITAIEAVKIIINDNKLEFNPYQVIGYGHSHGAYLLHLSNVLASCLFSYIIDNSAWLDPVYLSSNRYLYKTIGKATLAIEFDYKIAKRIIKNKHDLHLSALYSDYSGNTQIISFQGDHDNLINHLDKKKVLEDIPNSNFILITKDDIDNKKYKSNTHGLNADFLELFEYAMEFEKRRNKTNKANKNSKLDLSNIYITSDFSKGLPVFSAEFK